MVWLALFFNLAGRDVWTTTVFSPPSAPPSTGTPSEPPRVKRYRVDFFNRILVPPEAVETETVVEELPETESAEPEIPVEEEPLVTQTDEQPNVVEQPTVAESTTQPAQAYESPVKEFHGVDEQPGFYFPDLDFADIYGNPVDNAYIHNPERYEGTVIYIVDVSRPGGFQTLTDWAELWGTMLKIPGVVEPPNLISFSVAVADPYAPQARYLADSLRRKVEREKLLDVERTDGTIVRHTHVPDAEGRILDKLGIAGIDAPLVFLLDGNGGVMMRMEGRLRDMGRRDVDITLSSVQDLWGMSDLEVEIAKRALLAYLNRLRGEE